MSSFITSKPFDDKGRTRSGLLFPKYVSKNFGMECYLGVLPSFISLMTMLTSASEKVYVTVEGLVFDNIGVGLVGRCGWTVPGEQSGGSGTNHWGGGHCGWTVPGEQSGGSGTNHWGGGTVVGQCRMNNLGGLVQTIGGGHCGWTVPDEQSGGSGTNHWGGGLQIAWKTRVETRGIDYRGNPTP